MAGKRKDSNGILLGKGESQLADGRYRFRYTDNDGVQHDVYSWALRPEDKTPEGRKPGKSLREQEQQIQKDMLNGLKTWKGGMSLNSLIQEYLDEQKVYWSDGTYVNCNGYFNKHIKPKFGKRKVANITQDDVLKFYSELLHRENEPLSIGSLGTIDRLLNPAFKKAVAKKIISSNPASGVLGMIKKKNPDSKADQRHALEDEQLQRLLDFIAEDTPEYYNLFYFLAWTGVRINEAAALTWLDIDFKREVIYIRRSMQYQPDDTGKYHLKLKNPKTEAGVREIPMLADVKSILKQMQSEQKVISLKSLDEISVDDVSMFVFHNTQGRLLVTTTVDMFLYRVVKTYNREHSEAEALPEISAHILRHTFCCWLCENLEGTNTTDDLKYIQSVLGHADASTTLNIYSECRKSNNNSKHEQLKRIAAQGR